MTTRDGHVRLATCLLTLAILVGLVVLHGYPAQAFSLPEILAVRGCRDSSPPRSTSGCFAGAKRVPTVDLSLRGLHFPQPPADEAGEHFGEFRVELVESLPVTTLDSSDEGQTAAVPHLRLPCENAQQSQVFPSQIITCTLRNPLDVEEGGDPDAEAEAEAHKKKVLALWEAAGGAVWFDVVVRVLTAGERGMTVFEDLAVHRRAVQVDLTQLVRKEGGNVGGASAPGFLAYNISTHPLERLYASKPKTRADAEKTDGGSAVPEPDEEDYLWVELGIGGLKKELRELFRRVFLSRLPSLANLTEMLDIQHVRGVILYGPPGNGKSLIARSLFKLLGPDTRLTVVNAADVLSKFVGESEKNLRDAFGGYPIGTSSQAETDRKDGKDSGAGGGALDGDEEDGDGGRAGKHKKLHVLVIDEFESLFRRRGHSEDESSAKAVYDGVTNTLLSLMDGIENRNDLLVVGLTNRLQSIDSAMLRPGRFEVLIEVPSPDVPAREEIFFIHTAKLREEGFLADDVALHDLAVRSGGFSGSDIAGTVRSATSYALLRFRQEQADAAATGGVGCDVPLGMADMPTCGDVKANATAVAFQVTTDDLNRAMDDIRSAKDETSSLTYLSEQDSELTGAVDYDGSMSYRTRAVSRLVRQVSRSRLVYTGVVGIAGGAGTGKSFHAKQLTTVHTFDTVRFLSCRRLAELRDRGEQLEQVRDALGEASRVHSGLVVLDDFDILVDSLSGHPVYEATLRNMLYEYRHRPKGVSRSLQGTKDSAREASEVGGGGITVNAGSALHDNRNRRFLILTSTRQDALTAAEPDVRLRVRAIHRAGLLELLAHYNVTSLADARRWGLMADYPPTISFRNFLRVTERAIWLTEMGAGAEDGDAAAAFTSGSGNPFFGVSSASAEGNQSQYLLSSNAKAAAFKTNVRSVTAAMSLSDSFTGWYTTLPRTDLYEKVSGKEPADAAEKEEPDEDAGAGAGDTAKEADEEAADFGIETVW